MITQQEIFEAFEKAWREADHTIREDLGIFSEGFRAGVQWALEKARIDMEKQHEPHL